MTDSIPVGPTLASKAAKAGETDHIEVPLVLSISTRRIADLMVTAVEGSINYWCDGIVLLAPSGPHSSSPWYDSPELYSNPELRIKIIENTDEGENSERIIELADIRRGFALMAERYGKHFHDFMTENEDAVTADVLLQLVTLGEVIYG